MMARLVCTAWPTACSARSWRASARVQVVDSTDGAWRSSTSDRCSRATCWWSRREHVAQLGRICPADCCPAVLHAASSGWPAPCESALGAGGTFVAMNNKVSQSVPHLHTHVVPRTKGDGLRGFFWPRTRYASDEEAVVRVPDRRRASGKDLGPARRYSQRRMKGVTVFLRHKKLDLPTPDEALPGRSVEMPVADRHTVLGTPLKGPWPAGLRGRRLRHGLLLGRRAHLLAAARRVLDLGRLRRRHHAEPDVRGGLLGPHRPHRGGPGRLRPGQGQLRARC